MPRSRRAISPRWGAPPSGSRRAGGHCAQRRRALRSDSDGSEYADDGRLCGYGLIRQREGHRRRVPIIALTAHDAAGYRETCITAGMDDLLSKPYTLEECAQLLRRWIGGRANRPPAEPLPAAQCDALRASIPRPWPRCATCAPVRMPIFIPSSSSCFESGSTKSLGSCAAPSRRQIFEAAAARLPQARVERRERGRIGVREDVRLLGSDVQCGERRRCARTARQA